MPYLMTRFAALVRDPTSPAFANGLLYEVQKNLLRHGELYGPYPWPTLLKLVPVSHILFGTDFPFLSRRDVAKGVSEAGLKSSELQAIERENALNLFPRLKNV